MPDDTAARAALEGVAAPIVHFDAKGTILAITDAACHLMGGPDGCDLVGGSLLSLVDDTTLAGITDAVQTQLAPGGVVELGVGPAVTGPSPQRHMATLAQLAGHPSEPVFQLQFAIGTIARNGPDAERVAYSTAAAGIAVWEYDLETDILRWDVSFSRLYGYPETKLAGTYDDWRKRVHEDDLMPMEDDFAASIKSGQPFETIFRVHPKNGGVRTLKAHTQSFFDDDGVPSKVVGLNYDITQQVDAQTRALENGQLLRHANDRLNRLADNSPGALFEVRETPDAPPELTYYSAQFAEMLGVADVQHPMQLERSLSRVHPDDLDVIAQTTAAARADTSTYSLRYRIDHPDRGERWILAKAKPVVQDDGAMLWHGVLFDITDFERSEARAAEMLRRTNDRLNRLADSAPGALFEYREEPDGTPSFPYTSAKFAEMFGLTDGQDVRDPAMVFSIIHPDDLPEVVAKVDASRATMTTYTVRYRIAHASLGERWIFATSEPVAQDDGAIIWYGFLLDITEHQRSEDRAAAALEERNKVNARLSKIAKIAPVGLYEMCRTPDGKSHFPYCNDHFLELSGLTREDILIDDTNAFNTIVEDDLPGVRHALDVSANTLQPFVKRFRIRNPAGGISWMSIVADITEGQAGEVNWTGAMIDVSSDVAREDALRTARRKAEHIQAENEWQALHDGLTGLPNRRYFDRTFHERLTVAKSGGVADALLVRIDLDHFKHVNDILGHEAGDHVLKRVADVLKSSFRAVDFPARIGGDEFSVLMAPGTSEADALNIVERARLTLAEPMYYNDRPCRFGSSFGLAATDDLADVGDELHLYADAALYRAKTRGRNRVETYTPSLHKELTINRRIAEQLHIALEEDQFEPYFQPQFYTKTGALAGTEVLLRWNHPTDGVLAPGDFMAVADQIKVVGDIDRVVMEKCRDAIERFREKGIILPKVGLNVSASRMHDPNVIDLARSIASPDTRIAFELLESILVEEESDVFRFHLDQIRDAGIEIEIDDFGSGHASILSVMESQASALKIDQRLIKPLSHDERARSLVRAIIEIADTLDISTVAEGVETKEHVEILQTLGCDVLQGYLFSRPLNEEAFARFVAGLSTASIRRA
ncbi:MAG: EAL domain-containing protein [Pseudomonadota bacterium]